MFPWFVHHFGRLAISRPVCWFTNVRIVSRLTGTIAKFLFISFLSPVFALSLGIILLDAWDSPNRRWSIPFIRVGIGGALDTFTWRHSFRHPNSAGWQESTSSVSLPSWNTSSWTTSARQGICAARQLVGGWGMDGYRMGLRGKHRGRDKRSAWMMVDRSHSFVCLIHDKTVFSQVMGLPAECPICAGTSTSHTFVSAAHVLHC